MARWSERKSTSHSLTVAALKSSPMKPGSSARAPSLRSAVARRSEITAESATTDAWGVLLGNRYRRTSLGRRLTAASVLPNTFNQRDEVIGNGDAFTFRSRFNYHGFRYVRVTGLENAPDVSSATGYFIRTAYDRAGEFTSSNELLNRIYQMVTRTYEAL